DCSLPGSWGRRKRWDFWAITGPGVALNVTCADVDYLGLGDAWFRDLSAGEECTATAPTPLARGFDLPPRPGVGRISVDSKRLRLTFHDAPDHTRIEVAFPTRSGPFAADLRVDRPAGHEP